MSHRLVEDKMIGSKTLCTPSTDKACSGEHDSQSLRMAQHAARDSFAARRRQMLCTRAVLSPHVGACRAFHRVGEQIVHFKYVVEQR